MPAGLLRHRVLLLLALVSALALPACGGGTGGGAGPDGAGQGLILVNFFQSGQDNVPINRILKFVFSEPVDPSSIMVTDTGSDAYGKGVGSLQIRQGDAFGLTATGKFKVDGSTVYFEPRLPTLCDSSDAGLQPGTTYRVTVMGYPEEYSVKNSKGQPLDATVTYEFSTRPDSDPEYLEDQIPATPPAVTSMSPANSVAAVTVDELNEITIGFTENLDPCTVDASSVLFQVYEVGDPDVNNEVPSGEEYAGNKTGFTPWDDQTPNDYYSWGSSTGGTLLKPQLIPSEIVLVQSFSSTQLMIRPNFGRFPENVLCVVDLTFAIRDFGGSPLAPTTFSFTTQNLVMQEGVMTVEFDTTTEPWPQADRTADIDTTRSPGLSQGWLLFAGDGDNGGNTDVTPSFPIFAPTFVCAKRPNDTFKDNFEARSGDSITFNTGSTRVPSSCENETDGSQAVVWEFATFVIRNGGLVKIVGENPAIILVQGEVLIENGGELRVRGGRGGNGDRYTASMTPGKGGNGVAGGSDGGKGYKPTSGSPPRGNMYGDDGFAGYGSEAYNTPVEQGGLGAGHGNVAVYSTVYAGVSASGAGGGGGHGDVGGDGTANVTSGTTREGPPDGAGGGIYPVGGSPAKLYTPSAGSGGGASGWGLGQTYSTYFYQYNVGPAAGGGGGGGFVDLTSQADIRIYGKIDAAGGRGGTGGNGYYWVAAGGGGGSGGAIRLLTPANIDVTGGTLSTAGGVGGTCGSPQFGTIGTTNTAGAGGVGRICLEDGDSVITGMSQSSMTPQLGHDAFYVGEFQSTRFLGGGKDSVAVSGPMFLGPLSPATFLEPTADDFLCAIPSNAAKPPAGTGIFIEAAGYPMNPDGTVDDSGGDHWYTVGYFAYSGSPSEPNWIEGSNPPDVLVVNDGTGIEHLNGNAYVRLRIRFFLPDSAGATTPGPWMDRANFRFTYDQ